MFVISVNMSCIETKYQEQHGDEAKDPHHNSENFNWVTDQFFRDVAFSEGVPDDHNG